MEIDNLDEKAVTAAENKPQSLDKMTKITIKTLLVANTNHRHLNRQIFAAEFSKI